MTDFTPDEILISLDLTGKSPARVVVEISSRCLSPTIYQGIYAKFDGAAAHPVSDRLIATVVTYLLHDAAKKLPLDIPAVIARTEALAAAMPYNYSEAAVRERTAGVKVTDDDSEGGGKTIAPVDPDAPKRGRGRPSSGDKSAYQQAKELYDEAVDKTKDAVISMLQVALGIQFGSAQTYYYKAKKEAKV